MSSKAVLPIVEFHDADASDPLAPALALAIRACASGQRSVILADDDAQARVLDERLWAVAADVFVPHALADDPDRAAARVLIVAPGQDAPTVELAINLRSGAATTACARIAERIPPDEEGKRLARERWRDYLARGIKPVRLSNP